MTVTANDLRQLLGSTLPAPTLVLEEGSLKIFSGEEVTRQSPWVVTTRDDLLAELPDADNPTEHDLVEKAALLDELVSSNGA
ncbi:hypothetical protein [Rhodococcus tukisamuensis]|uniref:Uncharacterized protein n=1 Tax=Rhodococcus tukisamuensis TaxID=168276 RepID=A0A1G6Z8T9_9NOCA|nr:hypothetical protein [Rhodococcus tukisamuensis]SDD98196.1 hypothetical protein SAMN05444580_108126 [Rhodococcus tukisamuensis]